MFSKLYIDCQSRSGDLDEFFTYENQGTPPSLSDMGRLYKGNKSEIVKYIYPKSNDEVPSPQSEVTILDGAAIVNMMEPNELVKTFEQYASQQFIHYIASQHGDRIDVVGDEYHANSLKSMEHERRYRGMRRSITPSTNIPSNWHDFFYV